MFHFQIEDKAKASAAWSRISNAAKNLGVSPQEAHCLWSVLAAIYHLGVASVSKGNMVSSYKMDPSYYILDSKVLFFSLMQRSWKSRKEVFKTNLSWNSNWCCEESNREFPILVVQILQIIPPLFLLPPLTSASMVHY